MVDNRKIEVKVENLKKTFGTFTAVNGVSFEVYKGEVFGLLGPNGAGKTTTMNMLTTLLKPTSGKAVVHGFDIEKQSTEVRKNIGVVPQEYSLYDDLTIEQNISFFGDLYGIKESELKKKSKYLIEKMELENFKDTLVEDISGGMKERVSIATSLLPNPSVMFMDEPTTGIDPQNRIKIRGLTKEFAREGKTIIYTTHDMDEAEKLCDRVAIFDHGNVIALDTPENLKKQIKGKSFTVTIQTEDTSVDEELKKLKFVDYVIRSDSEVEVSFIGKSEKDIQDKIKEARVVKVEKRDPNLEDVFIKLTGRALRD
jgi:ABC-2 type transport system ATP-binding protein